MSGNLSHHGPFEEKAFEVAAKVTADALDERLIINIPEEHFEDDDKINRVLTELAMDERSQHLISREIEAFPSYPDENLAGRFRAKILLHLWKKKRFLTLFCLAQVFGGRCFARISFAETWPLLKDSPLRILEFAVERGLCFECPETGCTWFDSLMNSGQAQQAQMLVLSVLGIHTKRLLASTLAALEYSTSAGDFETACLASSFVAGVVIQKNPQDRERLKQRIDGCRQETFETLVAEQQFDRALTLLFFMFDLEEDAEERKKLLIRVLKSALVRLCNALKAKGVESPMFEAITLMTKHVETIAKRNRLEDWLLGSLRGFLVFYEKK